MMADLAWRKSSRSSGNNDQCVELACRPGERLVRDSKNASGPVLTFSATAVEGFLASLRTDRSTD